MSGEDGVEQEARDEAVEDQVVVYLLQGGEDTGEGAEEVIEDLEERLVWRGWQYWVCIVGVDQGWIEGQIRTANALSWPVPPC